MCPGTSHRNKSRGNSPSMHRKMDFPQKRLSSSLSSTKAVHSTSTKTISQTNTSRNSTSNTDRKSNSFPAGFRREKNKNILVPAGRKGRNATRSYLSWKRIGFTRTKVCHRKLSSSSRKLGRARPIQLLSPLRRIKIGRCSCSSIETVLLRKSGQYCGVAVTSLASIWPTIREMWLR